MRFSVHYDDNTIILRWTEAEGPAPCTLPLRYFPQETSFSYSHYPFISIRNSYISITPSMADDLVLTSGDSYGTLELKNDSHLVILSDFVILLLDKTVEPKY
jgi:hypothetical protein